MLAFYDRDDDEVMSGGGHKFLTIVACAIHCHTQISHYHCIQFVDGITLAIQESTQ